MIDIKTDSKSLRLIYFWIGILAAFAYRVIIVLNFFEPIWVKVAWYIGTIGFIFYFWSRYRVVKQYSRLIREQELVSAVKKSTGISKDQKQALSHIIESLRTTKAQHNYEIIFILSIIALFVGLTLDFL
jgi:hypothetical protein